MVHPEESQSFNLTKNQSEGVISTKGQLGAQLSQEEEKEIGDVGWKAFWDYSSFSRGLVIRQVLIVAIPTTVASIYIQPKIPVCFYACHYSLQMKHLIHLA